MTNKGEVMKWLLTLFMVLAASMSLISCSKKDDSAKPNLPSCYSGAYLYDNWENRWVDAYTYRPVSCNDNQNAIYGGQGGGGICVPDYRTGRPIPVQSCGGNGYQVFGIDPQTGQCVRASYCN